MIAKEEPKSGHAACILFPVDMRAAMNHPINWLQDSRRSLETILSAHPEVPKMNNTSSRLADRLSSLLLERLPPDLALQLIELLPDSERSSVEMLQRSARSASEASI